MSIPENRLMKPPIHLLLVLVLFCILTLRLDVFGQELLSLEEPSWVYRGRGDRYARNGDYGEAVAEYKKALIKKKHEVAYPVLAGIHVEAGLSRIAENVEGEDRLQAYGRLLFLFLNHHSETIAQVRSALENGRTSEARQIVQSLQHDAYTIGAEQVQNDSAALEQAIFKRNSGIWYSLLNDLSNSLDVVTGTLDSLTLVRDTGTSTIRGDRLDFEVEHDMPYPEVYLALGRIYAEEGLYELAHKQLDLFERYEGYLQVHDVKFEALYLRAEIFSRQGKKDEYDRTLQRIIEKDDNWDAKQGGLKGYTDRRFSQISESRIQMLSRSVESRGKFGKAYFEIGRRKYLNGSEPGAEPYLIMAFLYGYEGEEARALLERYYLSTNQPGNLKKLADTAGLLHYY
jgi:tetratricopeptide (TPR) repeat protein